MPSKATRDPNNNNTIFIPMIKYNIYNIKPYFKIEKVLVLANDLKIAQD